MFYISVSILRITFRLPCYEQQFTTTWNVLQQTADLNTANCQSGFTVNNTELIQRTRGDEEGEAADSSSEFIRMQRGEDTDQVS